MECLVASRSILYWCVLVAPHDTDGNDSELLEGASSQYQ
jgi:hypothetical protein